MHTQKVINALKKYSPHGLCEGSLATMTKSKDLVGCATGCLIFDLLDDKASAEEIASEMGDQLNMNVPVDVARAIVINNILDLNEGPEDTNIPRLQELLKVRFDVDYDDLASIVSFNDECLSYEDPLDSDDDLPLPLRKTILELRQRNATYNRRAARNERDRRAAKRA